MQARVIDTRVTRKSVAPTRVMLSPVYLKAAIVVLVHMHAGYTSHVRTRPATLCTSWQSAGRLSYFLMTPSRLVINRPEHLGSLSKAVSIDAAKNLEC